MRYSSHGDHHFHPGVTFPNHLPADAGVARLVGADQAGACQAESEQQAQPDAHERNRVNYGSRALDRHLSIIMGAMRTVMISLLAVYCVGTSPVAADVSACDCDPAKPETLQARDCSLCKEAEKQPAGTTVFFLDRKSVV